jgi:hypothetical protein
MKLRLWSNPNPNTSKPKHGHLKLVTNDGLIQKKNFEITSYAFQVFSPNPSVPVIQKTGPWRDFMDYMEMISFQSKNRKPVFDEYQNAIILACAKVAPILENGELGEIKRMSLILPEGRDKPIPIVYDHQYYRDIGPFLFGKGA